MASLAHKVSHKDVTALRNTETEQIDEHDHIVAVGTRGECLIADLIDEIGDDHLRETIRDILTHTRDADVQQISQLLPGDGTEIVKRGIWTLKWMAASNTIATARLAAVAMAAPSTPNCGHPQCPKIRA